MKLEVARTSVNCESEWHEFYKSVQAIDRRKALDAPFSTMYNAFVAFAAIGRYHDTYVPLKDKQEIFNATYFDREKQVPVLVSLAYEHLVNSGEDSDKALSTALNSAGFVPVVEGWANGGVRIFHEHLKTGNPMATLALVDLIMPDLKEWM